MSTKNLVTKDDLYALKVELVEIIKLELQRWQKPTEIWLKREEVMQMLGVSPSGLQNLRATGKLPYSWFGGKLYYKQQDILDILQKNYTKAA